MKTIIIKHEVGGTSTNSEGSVLKSILSKYLADNTKVQVSFKGTTPMSSSFFNTSFGDLIDEYGYDKFANCITPIDIIPSHLRLIKRYIQMHLEN